MAEAITQDDLDKLRRDLAEQFAPAWVQTEAERLRGWRKTLEADAAFGNIMGATQWVGGTSIVDGTVSGKKFTAEVVISSLFQTAEGPADRWELDPAGIRQYATVAGTPNQKIVDINGSGFNFGTSGANAISFNAATGVLSAPGLLTTSLSVANVTSGVVGGTYDTSVGNPKVQLSPNGLRAFNGAGTTTVDIAGGSGNVTITGVFEISNATIGDRIQLKDTGIELWRSGTRQFYLAQGSNNAIQMLLTGPSASQYIGMQPDTGFWVGASTIGAAPFRVSATGTMTAIGATIQSASTYPRVDLTSSGLIAYNASAIQTVNISGTGSTITGGLLRTAASGSRVEMDSTGLYGYSGATPVFKVGTDGTGYLGGSGGLTWNGTSYSVNGSAIITNSLDGAKLIASSVSSTQIGSAAITAGKIGTAAIATANIQNAAVGDAQIGSMSAGKLTTGSLTSTIITIGAGGRIQDGDGSYWDSTGIVLASVGSFGDSIRWRVSGVDKAGIYASSSDTFYRYTASGAYVQLTSSQAVLSNTTSSFGLDSRGAYSVGKFYPGSGTSGGQASYYIDAGSIQFNGIGIGGMLGISSGNTINFVAPGTGGSGTPYWSAWAATQSTITSYFNIMIAGTTYRVPFFANG